MKYLASLLPRYEPLDTIAPLASSPATADDPPVTGNVPKPHQKLPIKYLAPHTPYEWLLLVHDPGTGKTFIAYQLIAMYAKLNQRTFVLSSHPTITIDHLLKLDAQRTHEVSIRNFFVVKSYKDVECNMSTAEMERKIANYRLLIADELHTIYDEDSTSRRNEVFASRYQKNLDFFNICARRGVKRLGMTATPQSRILKKDDGCQTTQILTLLSGRRIETLTDVAELKGGTSVYRAEQMYTTAIEVGEKYAFDDGTFSSTTVVVDELRGYQKKRCGETALMDNEVFCEPEVLSINTKAAMVNKPDKGEYYRKNMWQFSTIYHHLFESMGLYDQDPEKKRQVIMWFSERVVGDSGNEKLREIMKVAWRFEEVIDLDEMMNIVETGGEKRDRFCFVSGQFGHKTDESIMKLIEIESHPNNKYGEYIRLIIISYKGSVGFNWRFIRQVHILLNAIPSMMKQTLGRCFRGSSPFEGAENFVKIHFHLINTKGRVKHLRDLEAREREDLKIERLFIDVSIERLFAGRSTVDDAHPIDELASDCRFVYDFTYNKTAVRVAYERARLAAQASLDAGVFSMPLAALRGSQSRNETLFSLARIIKTGRVFVHDGVEYELSNESNVLYFRPKEERRSALWHILNPTPTSSRKIEFGPALAYFCELARRQPPTTVAEYAALPILAKMYVFEACFVNDPTMPMKHQLRLDILSAERTRYRVDEQTIRHQLLSHYHSKHHAIYIGGAEREYTDATGWRNVKGEVVRVRLPPPPPPGWYRPRWFFETTVDGAGNSVTKKYSTRLPGKGQSVASIRTEDRERYIIGFLADANASMSEDRLREQLSVEWPGVEFGRGSLAALIEQSDGDGRRCDDFFVKLQRATTGYEPRRTLGDYLAAACATTSKI